MLKTIVKFTYMNERGRPPERKHWLKKDVIVASQLYDVADVQFTVEKECPLELTQFIQKYNLGNSVPNIVIMLRIFLTIAVSVTTC